MGRNIREIADKEEFLLTKEGLVEAQTYTSKTRQEIPWETHTELLETVYKTGVDIPLYRAALCAVYGDVSPIKYLLYEAESCASEQGTALDEGRHTSIMKLAYVVGTYEKLKSADEGHIMENRPLRQICLNEAWNYAEYVNLRGTIEPEIRRLAKVHNLELPESLTEIELAEKYFRIESY
jgi:hypothetical protein